MKIARIQQGWQVVGLHHHSEALETYCVLGVDGRYHRVGGGGVVLLQVEAHFGRIEKLTSLRQVGVRDDE